MVGAGAAVAADQLTAHTAHLAVVVFVSEQQGINSMNNVVLQEDLQEALELNSCINTR